MRPASLPTICICRMRSRETCLGAVPTSQTEQAPRLTHISPSPSPGLQQTKTVLRGAKRNVHVVKNGKSVLSS
ncbi:hypothetical protein BAUCODRAFT_29108 [Baudoinia panamericana UAMH 10762]|uniref:Uncharacterized protein n=1 Tax=Baudoinia panamericana (strain UAMH 10762) TaxID=717646 RepID=M2N9A1_BAUPA|nr:uncharacterized protein BAUCODRAFT_29108 [Baudoinia panamericana UAMH 10762]EMD00749.1 hypothetical protein BAUCODRAFT_29108 [Baudoinia panamericana UAMH 10762]